VSLNKYNFDFCTHSICVLVKFLANEVFTGISCNLVKGAQVYVDLAHFKGIPSVLSANVLEPFTGLVSSSFVDYIKDKFTINVKHINNNKVIEIDIVLKVKLEST
jgi:hypothetical protein